jgi:hypothetical protein
MKVYKVGMVEGWHSRTKAEKEGSKKGRKGQRVMF